jgi:diguanylate cyclase
MDDYGVRQTSLARLNTGPVHELKVDRIFVRSAQKSPTNAAIVSSTIALCYALGLNVVAEGAETAEELEWPEQRLRRRAGLS